MEYIKFNEKQFSLTGSIRCEFYEDGMPYLYADATMEGEPYILIWEMDWENCTMSDDEMAFAYD